MQLKSNCGNVDGIFSNYMHICYSILESEMKTTRSSSTCCSFGVITCWSSGINGNEWISFENCRKYISFRLRFSLAVLKISLKFFISSNYHCLSLFENAIFAKITINNCLLLPLKIKILLKSLKLANPWTYYKALKQMTRICSCRFPCIQAKNNNFTPIVR